MPGITMNRNRGRQTSFSSNPDSRYGIGLHGQFQPAARVLLDGYTESSNGSQQRYDNVCLLRMPVASRTDFRQMNENNLPNSTLPNVGDPVVMQSLMETAMDDSQEFQIMSQEESDAIRKELSVLATRMDGTKRKLVLEIKLRDAAQSLNRLQDAPDSVEASPKPTKRHRRSVLGSRGSLNDILNKTDDEIAVSTRKCDELAQELWNLEKRVERLQIRLLEHTAAVLQRTHKGFLKMEAPNSRSADPSGCFNGRDGYQTFDLTRDFDDNGFLPTLDSFLDYPELRTNGRASTESPDYTQQTQAILETERKLEDLNSRLRESIVRITSTSQPEPVPPVRGLEIGQRPGKLLDDQLRYLAECFTTLQECQGTIEQEYKSSADIAEHKLENLNAQLREIITRSFKGQKSDYPSPPEMTGKGPEGQIDYLEAGLDTVQQWAQRLNDDKDTLSSQAADSEGKTSQYDAVLLGLWEILLGGEEEVRRQDPIQREVRNEGFSIQAFSAKVQTLFARATGLQEQKEILARQVQQQREVNSNSDSQKNIEVTEISLELEQAKQSLSDKEQETNEARDNLVLMTAHVDAMRQEASLLEQQQSMNQEKVLEAEKEARKVNNERLQAELEEKKRLLTDLEIELAETKDDFGVSSAGMLSTLEESNKRIQSLNNDLQISRNEQEKSQNEMRELEGQIVVLQTELTVAKAELDGAYGTRAQRAAEQASNPAKQQEFEELNSRNMGLTAELVEMKNRHQAAEHANIDLNQRMQTLQRELTETIGEYEAMTRASIEFEREREQIESNMDALRERCESAEGQLSEEKVRWLGMKSPGSTRDSMSQGTTSTQVLKNEFKKMMRDTRAENMRALRVSCKTPRANR